MPVWTYIYCGFIVFGSMFNLFDKQRLKRLYQPVGEIACGLCGIAVFLIAYQVIDLPHAPVISSLCFVYTWVWAFHAHRHYIRDIIDYQKFRKEHHEWAKKAHEDSLKDYAKKRQAAIEKGAKGLPDLSELEQAYDREQADKTARFGYAFVMLFVLLPLAPYVYVYLISVGVVTQ